MNAFDPPDPSLRAGAAVDLDPDAPVIIGVAFDTATRAQEYLLAMAGLRNAGKLDLKDAVVVGKNDDGKVSVTETLDPTPGRAAASGAMWTGLLGLIVGGPIGWLAGLGVGAGIGAVTAKVVDIGIPDEWVGWFKQAVAEGTTAVVILAEHVHVRELAAEAKRFRGRGAAVHIAPAKQRHAAVRSIRQQLITSRPEPAVLAAQASAAGLLHSPHVAGDRLPIVRLRR